MYKFLSSVIIMTSLSLSYVYQQTKLLEYSYNINNNQKRLCLLIDQSEGLRYNVATLESPGNLKRRLASNNIALDTPQNWRNIRLARAESEPERKELASNNSFRVAAKILLNIFTPKAEAIAQELNPVTKDFSNGVNQP